MSFVDLATLTLHRQNELETRINVFLNKCDNAIGDLEKLKVQAQTLVLQLNCEPSQLKDRFLSCMKHLDEYMYLVTDFNLAVSKLDESSVSNFTPVHDSTAKLKESTLGGPPNLMDALSEPLPSTSSACPNQCPSEKHRQFKVAKEEQLLIAFSSTSCSSESVLQAKNKATSKEVQCQLVNDMNKMIIRSSSPMQETYNLPAQKVLQTDLIYTATIMSIDEISFWVITDEIKTVLRLVKAMTDYYKSKRARLTLEEIESLNYCAFYDDESDAVYRALFIKLIEGEMPTVEVFLVDTGEVRTAPATHVKPLEPQFCTEPPYARCCHLAGIDLHAYQNKELMEKQESFMREYVGTTCKIEIDDNTSESLGVFVLLPSKQVLNQILINKGLALPIDKLRELEPSEVSSGPSPCQLDPDSETPVVSDLELEQCPEYEDPVEAVTGYSNRDELDICKHYKGGFEKTCFKGSRCNKRHIMKHPDGWTLDRLEVPAKVRSMPLPEPGTWHKVLVTFVCHYDRLFVQFDKENYFEEMPTFGVILPPTTLMALVRDMNSPAARMLYKRLKMAPAVGELVAALYPLDNQWYRAMVTSVTRADQNVEVMYVDYGNVIWVKEDQIRVLESRYQVLPTQAVRCVLAGVVARTNDSRRWAEAKRALTAMTQDRKLNARVIGRELDELIVELYDEDGHNIAEQLAACDEIELKEYTVVDDTYITQKVLPA